MEHTWMFCIDMVVQKELEDQQRNFCVPCDLAVPQYPDIFQDITNLHYCLTLLTVILYQDFET